MLQSVNAGGEVEEDPDARNGAALRRLGEALATWANPREVIVREERRVFGQPSVFVVECEQWVGEGDTIAEAADRCREALGQTIQDMP